MKIFQVSKRVGKPPLYTDNSAKALRKSKAFPRRMPSEQTHFVQVFFQGCGGSVIVCASCRGTGAVGRMFGSGRGRI